MRLSPLLSMPNTNAPVRIPPIPPVPPDSETPPTIAADTACSIIVLPVVADALARLIERKTPRER